ncbi:GTPase-activating Rap/Ran-GAP domain-like protein 3,Rap1 GTPase-activating protein 2 [Mytilus coruscus]|uniref:GTPase-activating Rap/Ran-GAP domain-like protein 3,Rap1 GTPase-activating protein 2 n=1 Tax=Mytilus coruscus TaxID=42192 RepID=A0A6J8AXZ8_MYTCO|nr:GTPase-activating Rap/Ran-GAP domain-like protein 3,Rap1 GTPase-activating protein 2 [Mytilus coruscus]
MGHRKLCAIKSNPEGVFGCKCSPASDLTFRRDVFSRRQYGSVELLYSEDGEGTNTAGRFRVETGEHDGDEVPSPVNSPIHLENPEFQTRWYFKYFLGKLHQNYVGTDIDREPFLLSVVVTDVNNHNVQQYRAILWCKSGAKKICLPYNQSKPQTVKGILSHFNLHKTERGPKEIFDPEIQKDLLVLEEQEGSVNFKFGVIYAKETQSCDDEFYSNEHNTKAFRNFLELIGATITLKGWDKFKGGLDVKADSTGTESVYTVYEGHEIMFHVSTMLPHSKENKQQVERKRHIGNDIVNILFYECDSPQKYIFAVVCFCQDDLTYRLNVLSEESVPLFGPPLPTPAVFSDHQEFRDFLLVKLINGEKAAVNNPLFTQKRERTLDMLIKNLHQEYMSEINKNNLLYRRAFSDVIQDVQSSRKEEARRSEFVRVGQTLKLKTIIKGDAPTSLVTTGILKREPWEPQECFSEIENQIICGDSWGDKLLIVTDTGVLLLEDGVQPRILFDKSVSVKQLDVVEELELVLLRTDKGEKNENFIRGRIDCRDHKIEKTKGCHLYALSRSGSSHLRMVAAIHKRLLLFSWKHSAAFTSWCPTMDIDLSDGFTFVRELQSFEVPQLITLVDESKGDNQICVGYKNQFDLINEKNGDTLQLYSVDNNKVTLVSALDICEDEEVELLLTYNYESHFQKLSEEISNDFDFHWNSEPKSIVCAFPYVLAFTQDTIEIRLIINGNLVHTMTMPDISLITSKNDIYFGSSATDKKDKDHSSTTLSSPSCSSQSTIYKIPLSCLAGHISNDRLNQRKPSSTPLLAPITNGDKTQVKRSPLVRTKGGLHPPIYLEQTKERHDSSSSDSGITILKPSDSSPPESPYQKYIGHVVYSDVDTDIV